MTKKKGHSPPALLFCNKIGKLEIGIAKKGPIAACITFFTKNRKIGMTKKGQKNGHNLRLIFSKKFAPEFFPEFRARIFSDSKDFNLFYNDRKRNL